jgi:hypothetical protein
MTAATADDRIYVPDRTKWIDYYKGVASGKINSYTHDDTVMEGDVIQSSNANYAMIPIDEVLLRTSTVNNNNRQTQGSIKMVTPVEQAVEQAKAEAVRHPDSIMKIKQNIPPISGSISARKKRRIRTSKTKKTYKPTQRGGSLKLGTSKATSDRRNRKYTKNKKRKSASSTKGISKRIRKTVSDIFG